jgi:hypothetical protein
VGAVGTINMKMCWQPTSSSWGRSAGVIVLCHVCIRVVVWASSFFVAMGRYTKSSVLNDLPPNYQSLVRVGAAVL